MVDIKAKNDDFFDRRESSFLYNIAFIASGGSSGPEVSSRY